MYSVPATINFGIGIGIGIKIRIWEGIKRLRFLYGYGNDRSNIG